VTVMSIMNPGLSFGSGKRFVAIEEAEAGRGIEGASWI